MGKKSDLTTVEEARTALSAVGRKLEKNLGGSEKSLALRAVSLADKCLKFGEDELALFMNPITRDASLLEKPADISRIFKDAQSILSLFANMLKKTEEAEVDIERAAMLKSAYDLLEKSMEEREEMRPSIPIIRTEGNDSEN